MSLEEILYLENLKLYAFTQIDNKDIVYVTKNCNIQLYKAIVRTIGSKARVTYGDADFSNKNKYKLIIDHKNETNIDDLIGFKDNLSENGIITIGSQNHEYVQSAVKNKPNSYHLNRKTDQLLEKDNLYPIFREPVGKFNRLNIAKNDGLINAMLSKIGKLFPNSKIYSPYIVLIYRLEKSTAVHKRYKSATSLSSRIYRIATRKTFIEKIRNATRGIIFGIYYSNKFYKSVIPNIPIAQESSKKTLIIAMTYLQMGGVERVMFNIIKGINRKDFKIIVITTAPSSNPWHDDFQKYTDHIIHIPEVINEKWPERFQRKYFEEYTIRNNADVIFITNSSTAYKALPEIKNQVPGVRVYDLLHTHGTPKDKDAYLRISLPFDKYIDKRIVIDKYLKDYYINKYSINEDKISVIYNGIDNNSLKNISSNNNDPLFDSIPTDRKIVTFVGRLDEDKSPIRLVDIAIELKKRKLPISIVVVGDGTLNSVMVGKAKKTKILDSYIYFYGSSSNPLPLARRSDFTILVSNAEGIPMSVLESMSVSTPAICPAVGGIPEIIDHSLDGFLVPILSLENEAAKIEAFTDMIVAACALDADKYKKMQSNAKQKIIDRFSSMPQTYEHLFNTGEIL